MFNTTKEAQRIAKNHYSDYRKSTNYSLFDVYSSFSQNKYRIFKYWENEMNNLDGYGLKIISANSQTFTIGFEYPDKETGVLMFAYITKDYNRTCEI